MFSSKRMLQVIWEDRNRSRVLAAALAASGVLATRSCLDSINHTNTTEEEREDSSHNLVRRKYFALDNLHHHPFVFSVNTTACEFIRGPTFSRLARTRTIRRIEDSSAKSTLKSRYDVQWRTPIGEGGFGAVYLATDRKTKERVAIKQIAKSFTDNASFQREMNAFLHIRQNGSHPNICGLIENFDEGKYYYLVLDLVSGGEMFDHLINNGAFSEADAARLFREVGSALAFLHGINVIHGDLKPENLMLSSKNPTDAVIELVDFGCAQIVDKSSPFYEASSMISATTPGYSPPEMVDKSIKLTHLDPSMDMFSIGVILYVMLCGLHPYDVDGTASDAELNKRILERKLPPLRNSQYTAHLSRSAIELMEKLMQPNPKKRLTAQEMLDHPWVRGETAAKGKIKGSDERLKKFRRYKSQLEAKVFQNMVEFSGDLATSDIHKKASLIEQSFRSLDPEHKGYITTKQLKLLDPETKADNTDDDTQLSLSGFSDLLSDNMKNRYFPSGHLIYREGDRGKCMYFINSGRIEVSSKDGCITTRETGDFFGEGALLSKSGRRSASIKTLTPVHAIEISKEYFEKYLVASGYNTQLRIRELDKERKRNRAKTILASTKSMAEQSYPKGSFLYEQGCPGDEIFILEEGKVDVNIGGHTVYTVNPGEICGEDAAIFGKTRNTVAKCVSAKCLVHILKAEDFTKIVNSMASSSLKESLRDITHRREFQKALVFSTKKAFPNTESELREAFEEADYDRSGKIDMADLSMMLKQFDSTWTNEEILDILSSLDLDRTGAVSWEEFKRVFCVPR